MKFRCKICGTSFEFNGIGDIQCQFCGERYSLIVDSPLLIAIHNTSSRYLQRDHKVRENSLIKAIP